jgi:hypothetical protein
MLATTEPQANPKDQKKKKTISIGRVEMDFLLFVFTRMDYQLLLAITGLIKKPIWQILLM